MTYRELLCFDFDGVLSEGHSYHWPLTRLDVTPLRQAHDRGYACAVMTCNTVPWVVVALWRAGIKAVADDNRAGQEWDGSRDGRRVLVTNRKLAAAAYIDDRAIHHEFGQDPQRIFAELDRRAGQLGGHHDQPRRARAVVQ